DAMKRILAGAFALAALCLVLAPTVHAQVDRATLSGTVRDTSGGVMPGAAVVVVNAATNVSSESVTDAQGNYMIGGLIPGAYAVSIELAGFQKGSAKLDLEVGQRGRLDFTL